MSLVRSSHNKLTKSKSVDFLFIVTHADQKLKHYFAALILIM